MTAKRRKLRVLVITMGSERQQHIETLFGQMDDAFEPPAFSPGVPSRSLRNRSEFFRYAHQAGLLPQEEWEAIQATSKALQACNHEEILTERFFDCLDDVPVTTGRRGGAQDILLHYSVELWRKAKTVNRGRAVLGCTLAHLIAIKRLVDEGFDLILEDNVRAPVESCADRIWECLEASDEQQQQQQQLNNDDAKCHLRFMGWLGSIPNLKWILETHAPKRAFPRKGDANNPQVSVFPFPRTEHLKEDMAEMKLDEDEDEDEEEDKEDGNDDKESDLKKHAHKTPGGNPVWGCYAYWVSEEGYEKLMTRLRNDVGAMLWRGKRMRYYSVKPIDKILPRLILHAFNSPECVQLTTHPAFFRAPMLTSKIHTKWDPEFCKSTDYQMSKCQLSWSDLWLSTTEREVVDHWESNKQWLTIQELRGKHA
jgi:hypothetical protein